MEYLAPAQIKKLLRDYYDIPAFIADRKKMIAELQALGASTLQSPILTGMPKTGQGVHNDPTIKAVLASDTTANEKAIKGHLQAINAMLEKRSWLCAALATLDRTDRKLLEMLYMGPEEPKEREQFKRRPPWKEIAYELGYSESRLFARGKECIKKLSDLSSQTALTVFDSEKQ